MQLYLDCDGVLADFNKKAIVIFGMDPEDYDRMHGQEAFWKGINTNPNFFYELEEMADAHELYDAVKHLNPIILTGIPKDMNEFENQKILWSAKKFGKEQRIICCRAAKKHTFAKPGDILIDDRIHYKKKWESVGGIWITHTSAKNSLDILKDMGVL
jgi:hypothetical protein